MRLLYWLFNIDEPSSIAHASGWSWHAATSLHWSVIAIVIVLAVVMAGLNLLPQNVMRWRTRFTLAGIRLLGFAILLAMLCRLELRVSVDRDVRPTVAVLTDTSESMDLRDVDGKPRLDAAREFAAAHLSSLADRATVIPYSFDWGLKTPDAKAPPAGITHLIDSIQQTADRENDLQAIVVLTDGNDTSGNRGAMLAPLLASRHLPVYPVVFGDPAAQRTTTIKVTGGGAYVRLGDELKLSATLTPGSTDQIVNVKLMEVGKNDPIATRQDIRLGKEPVDITFAIKPDHPGERVYRIVLDGVKGSLSDKLLVAEHKVQVLADKIKVLYVDIPRDERKLLGYWLSRDPVVDLAMLTMLPKGGWYAQGEMKHKNAGEGLPNQEADLYHYDVIILGDIPRGYFRLNGDISETKMQRLVEFVAQRGGGLITLGGRSVYSAGQYQDSPLSHILPFNIENADQTQIPKSFKITPTVVGLSHPLMQLDPEATTNRETWMDLPSLDGCNRVGKIKPGASLLAVREMEGGPMPVIAIQNVGKGQVLSLAADTTWRWEMMRPADGEDHYRKFWGNAVRALAPDPRIQPDRPQVLKYESSTPVGQTITLATRLVDTVFHPVSGADVVVKVTSPSGKLTNIYPRDGRSAPGLYEYQVPLDEAGDWSVATTYKDQTTTEKITAGSGDEELSDPAAKLDAMSEFAKATGGKAFTPRDGDALIKSLDLTPRHVTRPAAVTVWNLPLTMILFITVVCLDTWMRKRKGMV